MENKPALLPVLHDLSLLYQVPIFAWHRALCELGSNSRSNLRNARTASSPIVCVSKHRGESAVHTLMAPIDKLLTFVLGLDELLLE